MTPSVDPASLSLVDIRRIYSNDMAFCGLRLNGSAVVWGKFDYGANTSSVQNQLTANIIYIHSNSDAEYLSGSFVALKNNGSVVAWGDPRIGGDISGMTNLRDIIDIQSTAGAYAVLKEDGSVDAWGNPERGGLIPSAIQGDLSSNVIQIISTQGAFAALCSDYHVVTWGDPNFGGNTGTLQSELVDIVDMNASPYTFTFVRADGNVYRFGYNAGKSYGSGTLSSNNTTSQPDILSTYHSIHSTALIEGDIYRPIPYSLIYGDMITPVNPFIHDSSDSNPLVLTDLSRGSYRQIRIDASFQIISETINGNYYDEGNSSPITDLRIELYLFDPSGVNSGIVKTYTTDFNPIANWTLIGPSTDPRPQSTVISVHNLSLTPDVTHPLYPYTNLNFYPTHQLYIRLARTVAPGAESYPYFIRFPRLTVRTEYIVLESALDIDQLGNEPIYNGLLSTNDKVRMMENIFYRHRIRMPPDNRFDVSIQNLPYSVIIPAPVLDSSYNRLDTVLESGNNVILPLRRGEIIKTYFGLRFEAGTGNVPIFRYLTYYNDTLYEVPVLEDFEDDGDLSNVLHKGPGIYDRAVYISDVLTVSQRPHYDANGVQTRTFIPFKSFRVSPLGTNYSFSYIVDRNRFLLNGITVTPNNQTGNEYVYQVTYVSSRGAPIRNANIVSQVPIVGFPQQFVPVSERDQTTQDVYCILTGFRGVVARMSISANNVSVENVVPLRLQIILPNVGNIYNTIYAYRLKDNGRERYTGENGDIPPGYNSSNYPIPVVYDNVSESWAFTLYSFSTYIFMTSAIPAGLTGGDPIVQPLRSANKRTVKLPNTWKRLVLYKDSECGVRVEAECNYLTDGMIRGMHSYRNNVERPYFMRTPDPENNVSDRKTYEYLRKNTFFSKIYLYRHNVLETTIDLFDPFTNYVTTANARWFQRIYPPSHEGVYSFGKRMYYPCSSQMHAYKVALEKENYLYVYSDIHWDECTSIRLEMNKYEVNRPIYSGELFEHSDEYVVELFG
jgi:hypothetical protein